MQKAPIFTPAEHERLLDNGIVALIHGRRPKVAPVVEVLACDGRGRWQFSELDPDDGDTLYGFLIDPAGGAQAGYVSLAQLSVRNR